MKYWIVWDGDYSHIVAAEQDPSYGSDPFATFAAAKKELLAYHRARMKQAWHCIRSVKAMKKTDVEASKKASA